MGPLLCLLSAACFGAMGIFGKLAFAAGVSPHALLLVRFAMAAAILLVVLILRPQLRTGRVSAQPTKRPALSAGVVATAFGLGAIGYAAQAGLYFTGLQRMDASLLSLVLYSYPLMFL